MNPRSEYDEATGSSHRRLHELIGLEVRLAGGDHAGYVNDLRLAPSDRVRGSMSQLVTHGLVVGRRRHGTLLGYDRKRGQGPLIVRVAVLALHRHTGYAAWSAVHEIDFDGGVVHLSTEALDPLEPA